MNNKNKITYSDHEYYGHNNKEIKSLTNDLRKAKAKIRKIEQRIKDIQDNCVHEYMFVCSGMYEDSYTCIKCGYETEK